MWAESTWVDGIEFFWMWGFSLAASMLRASAALHYGARFVRTVTSGCGLVSSCLGCYCFHVFWVARYAFRYLTGQIFSHYVKGDNLLLFKLFSCCLCLQFSDITTESRTTLSFDFCIFFLKSSVLIGCWLLCYHYVMVWFIFDLVLRIPFKRCECKAQVEWSYQAVGASIRV